MMSDIKKELRINNKHPAHSIETGAMVETPAAAMQIRDILKAADFISIGTNDLIQYITAADRESIAVSHYYQNGITLCLKMVTKVISEARNVSKQCFLCGELAGNTEYTEALLATGLSDFSVLPPLLPAAKEEIYEIYHRTPEVFTPRKAGPRK
jgi:phosphoenolpyruvate-protein phosphotransferase (PTS system enzyme I)